MKTVKNPSPPTGISVVVITKNEEENIRVCLESLVKQDYHADSFEIIVVDASTDRTPTVVSEFPSVHLVKSIPGFSRQRNLALEIARFDIVAFVDADTEIPPGWLKGISAGFGANPAAAGIGGNAFPPQGTRWLGRCIAAVGHPAGGSIGLDANMPITPDGIQFIPGCNGAFRKNLLKAVGGYSPDFDCGGEDVDISRRLRKAGYRLDYAPKMTIYHKPHGPLFQYFKWNIGVGLTKYSLEKPGWMTLLLEPGSPVWAVLGFALLLWMFFFNPLAGILALCVLHGILQMVLRKQSRPYRILLARQKNTGLGHLSIWIVVPVLVYIRQLFMNIGMWKQWRIRRIRRGHSTAK